MARPPQYTRRAGGLDVTVTRTRTGAWIVRGNGYRRRRYRTYRQALLEHARRMEPRVVAAMRAGATCCEALDLCT